MATENAHVQAYSASDGRIGIIESGNDIALAKAIGARVTALAVSTPLNSLVIDPSIVSGALDQYKALVAEQTAKYLENAQCARGRRRLRNAVCRARQAL
jgi:hypothetical protein